MSADAAAPTCMLVDRSLMVRRVASRIVRELGFEIVEARSAEEALVAARLRMPDVVLMDWDMGDMEAPDLLAALRGLPGGDAATLILCTARRTVEAIHTALGAGADEYIMKPFDSDIVASKFRLAGLRGSAQPNRPAAA